MTADNADIAARIRTIPDYPKPGILFRDITTLLQDPQGFRLTIDRLADRFEGQRFDLIAGTEARGFVLAAALAYRMGAGKLMIRKPGKLPGETIGIDYDLEYGTDRLEMHRDAVAPGARVLLADDLIATGGTALAAATLLRQAGAVVTDAAFIVDLPDLGGADRLRAAGIQVHALVSFAGH